MSLQMSTDQEYMSNSDNDNEQIRRPSYASFGDEGVTATANSHGHLLQITRYLGNEPSGFFCVDLTGMPPPCLVTRRMHKLQDYFVDPHAGMRIRAEHTDNADAHIWTNEESPKLEFKLDRWPHFATETQKLKLSIQYFVSEKTVYQIYNFEARDVTDVEGCPTEIPSFVINARLLLRDLDFITGRDEDDCILEDENYSDRLSPNKDYIIRSRNIRPTGENNQDTIALFITPFINKCPQQLSPGYEPGDYKIILDPTTALERLREPRGLEITLAYRLELVSSRETSPSPPVSLFEIQNVLQIPFGRPAFTQDGPLNFTLGRNLEHILSVCSIPVGNDADGDSPSIALTCGDISGHRVSTPASFHSFQFLLLALEYLSNPSKCVYQSENDAIEANRASTTRSRIQKTCRGHLKWLCENAKLDQGLFGLGYWVNGAPILNQHGSSSLLKQSLFNSPLQIIKAAGFCRVAATDEGAKAEIADGFRSIVEGWVKALDENNKGRHFAFPNLREEMTQWVFNLSDHAIIWWAVKAAEELGFGAELGVNEASSHNISRQVMLYSSKKIQTSILNKFTIQNPLFEQGMVAVSRSCSETRLQFRPKDTALFYAMDLGLFDLYDLTEDEADTWKNKVEAWRYTVDYQKECDVGQNASWDWDQPLCYALALIMSSKNKQMHAQPILEMQQEARKILLDSSSSNGLFPGQLDENGGPAWFESEDMRDPFWCASFELPYILLRYQIPPHPSKSSDTVSTPSPRHTGLSLSTSSTGSTTPSITKEIIRTRDMPQLSSETHTCFENRCMKHGVLFTNAIDGKQIVEILDEWLYNEPAFFGFHAALTPESIDEFRQEACKLHPEKPPHDTHGSSTANDSWFWRTVKRKKALRNTAKEAGSIKHSDICTMKVVHEATVAYDPKDEIGPIGYIIDVPRVKHCKEANAYRLTEISSIDSLLDHVKTKRTPAVAKKRIFHFFHPMQNIVPICYLSSSEQKEISTFFDRHASSNPYFFEDTTRTLNKWVTELHLPFYQILSPEKSSDLISKNTTEPEGRRTIQTPKIIPFPHPDLNGNTKSLIQAIISFRFDGDLLDRYWTCHLMENCPQNMDDPKKTSFNIVTYPVNGALKSNPWRQRRVLELILFERVLQEMLRSTQEILEEEKGIFRASNRVGLEGWSSGSGSAEFNSKLPGQQNQNMAVGNNVFLSNDRLWYKIQEILQGVEEDLGENLAKIKLWINREDERGPDKPRWTHKDEYHYGGAIHKLRASNNFYIQELERCRAKISAFNTQLTREMENARSYWEIQNNEMVTLFTYTTVFFLPVSLATGVFSMNGIPSRRVIYSTLGFATVVFVLTMAVVLKFKKLRAMGQSVRYKLSGLSKLYAKRSFHHVVNSTLLILEVILECVFIVTRGLLLGLDKCYSTANRNSHVRRQKVLSRVIFILARYAYYPQRKWLLKMTSNEMEDPWGLSESDDHPIERARKDYKKD